MPEAQSVSRKQSRFLSPKQAASIAEVNYRTILNWAKAKKKNGMPVFRPSHDLKIPRKPFYKWLGLDEQET